MIVTPTTPHPRERLGSLSRKLFEPDRESLGGQSVSKPHPVPTAWPAERFPGHA